MQPFVTFGNGLARTRVTRGSHHMPASLPARGWYIGPACDGVSFGVGGGGHSLHRVVLVSIIVQAMGAAVQSLSLGCLRC
jgi:hypothetical protein